MTLIEKQMIFAMLAAKFVTELISRGYGVTEGEVWRAPEMAEIYAQQGKGIENSLHTLRLAVDLNLFKAGVFLTSVDDYREAGELWESYSTQDYMCCWGGRFQRVDADHFSIAHEGLK